MSYDSNFIPASILTSIAVIVIHLVIWYFNHQSYRRDMIEDAVHGYKGVDIIEHTAMETASKVFKFFINRERPFAMDAIRYLGIITFIIGACVHVGFPYTITIAILFFVGYDLFYLGFAIYAFKISSTDPNPYRRQGQYMVGYGYSCIGGFPLGTITKVALAGWLDRQWSLITGLSVYVYLLMTFLGVASLILGVGVLLLCCRDKRQKLQLTDCKIFLFGGISTLIIMLCLGSVSTVVNIVDKITHPNGNHTVFYSFLWDPSKELYIAPHMLVMWIPAILATTLFVYITSKHGIFTLYFPDYISFWLFIISSFLLVYHVDHLEETSNWIIDGVPFYPIVADVILGMSYYIYKRHHFLQEIDIETTSRGGDIILLNVPRGNLFNEIATLVHQTWKEEYLNIGRDARNQSCSTIHIKEILQLTTSLAPSNAAKAKYKSGSKELKKKYKGQDIPSITDLCVKNQRIDPVHSDAKLLGLDLLSERLDKSINETYLFHATRRSNVKNICLYGFQVNRSGSRAGKAFGSAVYFAEDSSKSDQYTDERDDKIGKDLHMFVVKVALGKTFVAKERDAYEVPPCQAYGILCRDGDCKVHARRYDSVLMDFPGMLYREYLVFEDKNIFPEFLVVYDKQ